MYPLRYVCNSLTNFEYEVYAMTGNGNYLNLLKLAWKKPVKSLQVLIYLQCLILQATVGDGFQELAGSNQAFGMTHSYSAGPKKKKFVKLIDHTYACNSLTNFEYIEGACNDRKRKFDQIKLLG